MKKRVIIYDNLFEKYFFQLEKTDQNRIPIADKMSFRNVC